jgi:thiamine biosynthesis lipoprotein
MQTKISRCRPLLGTYVEIRIRDAGSLQLAAVESAIDAAFAAIAQCVALMSFHDAGSDLSRINRDAYRHSVQVHSWTWQVLAKAKEFFESSYGVFDCGVGAQLVEWGVLPGLVTDKHHYHSSIADLMLLPENRVSLQRPACIDLGGIAKGFAVDRATDVLREAGILNAIVNAGGDLRVLGELEEALHIRHPANPQQLVLIGSLGDGALATSAPYFSAQPHQHIAEKNVCALVDAASREPLLGARSYSVIAADCCTADALTKVLAAGMPPDADCFVQHGAQTFMI